MTYTNRLKAGFFRQGPDYRFEDQVDFNEIRDTFGFKTMVVGKWVTKEERLVSANLIYDALADLAQILQIPPTAIGLRGNLNFAFGHGGQQNVQAHYNSNTRTLALAKNAGGGALAHEWFHAFDHHITKHLFPLHSSRHFASKLWLEHSVDQSHPINLILSEFYKGVFLDNQGKNANQYVHQCMVFDKQHQQFYMSMPEELAARCFEACISHQKNIVNHFLVSGITNSTLIYPDQKMCNDCIEPLSSYFFQLGQRLFQHP
ncbi:hypothetical protein AMS58_18575 [Pseudoalteromonas porphyrae]|uniref:Large polyvalent protein-associated domain-containing protein n=1 Tax=Pseudoalteromonas porphyrae TaxID=187330 RepID=A0A0N0LVH3_9GAMM|nr:MULTISPECIES: CLCA_X family protein [Pseudoalteromonas]KPH58261.1 hypothetical protein ADS77_17935 [Pseudoalteromonas porphyrae]KPH93168.1 hypothetical protein AMS58_18575 [Pseudoalteromonas porphyrae]NNG44928.1 hypothetical protein [Pseudoalteromonas sp. NEC-BIFX-2020_002]